MGFRNISAWAIRNPVIPIVLFTFLLAMGLMAFMRMDINLNPDIESPAATVSISQPGAAPPELEIQVTRRVEAAVRGINGVNEINSFIREGNSTTFVAFEIGTPIDRAVADVRDAIARISIPYNRDLRPGGFASAEIRAGSTTAPLLPESAVLTDDAGSYVMIVGPNNTVVRRPVRIGNVTDRGVIVAEGLSGNERVVESSGAFLNAGERIRPETRARPRR